MKRASDPDAEKRLKGIYTQIEKVAGNLAEDVRALNAAVPNEEIPPTNF